MLVVGVGPAVHATPYRVSSVSQWPARLVGGDVVTITAVNAFDGGVLTVPYDTSAGDVVIRGERKGSTPVGGVHFVINRSHVTLTGLSFSDTSPVNTPLIDVVNPDAGVPITGIRLTNLDFVNVGPSTTEPKAISPARRVVTVRALDPENNPVTDVRLDHSRFSKVNYAITVLVSNGVRDLRIDHNVFRDQARCSSNGCDILQIGAAEYGAPTQWQRYEANASIDHNVFINDKGESELISLKNKGNEVRWNFIDQCRGSINYRAGAGGSPISGAWDNIIIDTETSAFRVSGADRTTNSNIIISHTPRVPILLSTGNTTLATGGMQSDGGCSRFSGGQQLQYYTPVLNAHAEANWVLVDKQNGTSTHATTDFVTPNCGCTGSAATTQSLTCPDKAVGTVELENVFEADGTFFRDRAHLAQCVAFNRAQPWQGIEFKGPGHLNQCPSPSTELSTNENVWLDESVLGR